MIRVARGEESEESEVEDGKLYRRTGGLGGGIRMVFFPKSGGVWQGRTRKDEGCNGVGREGKRDGVRAMGWKCGKCRITDGGEGTTLDLVEGGNSVRGEM